MKIDGKQIAQEIFNDLSERVERLKAKGVTPKFVIILIGNDPASAAYVRQKELKAKQVGIETKTDHLSSSISQQDLLIKIQKYNNDESVSSVIIQQPLPPQIDASAIDRAVIAKKDVDGFRFDSPFLPPLGIAVYKILEDIPEFATKKIVILGKGKTGGSPIIQVLKQREIPFTVVDSKTVEPEKILRQADIVIAAVGKPNIITKNMVKKGVVLIGVGMYKGEDDKLHGDYEENDVKDIASHYSPIPGGVGPVNVAMLLANVVTAAEKYTK